MSMHMSQYMSVHASTHMSVYHVCTRVYAHVCAHVYTHVHIHVSHIHVFAPICALVHWYTCLCTCQCHVHTHVYTYSYACLCTCLHRCAGSGLETIRRRTERCPIAHVYTRAIHMYAHIRSQVHMSIQTSTVHLHVYTPVDTHVHGCAWQGCAPNEQPTRAPSEASSQHVPPANTHAY